ncbi:hypothetical protein C8J57DRAFT_348084 [Mycena rebaudengoi]|nr:hypothetical protein C8J57DRAFT_348084 [Mycena rebaudengoi]
MHVAHPCAATVFSGAPPSAQSQVLLHARGGPNPLPVPPAHHPPRSILTLAPWQWVARPHLQPRLRTCRRILRSSRRQAHAPTPGSCFCGTSYRCKAMRRAPRRPVIESPTSALSRRPRARLPFSTPCVSAQDGGRGTSSWCRRFEWCVLLRGPLAAHVGGEAYDGDSARGGGWVFRPCPFVSGKAMIGR